MKLRGTHKDTIGEQGGPDVRLFSGSPLTLLKSGTKINTRRAHLSPFTYLVKKLGREQKEQTLTKLSGQLDTAGSDTKFGHLLRQVLQALRRDGIFATHSREESGPLICLPDLSRWGNSTERNKEALNSRGK